MMFLFLKIKTLFRLFILLTILNNCVFMMISYSPAFTIAEYAFTAVYMFEVIIKIVSRGFCIGRFTFLRDPWNWLDVMVISTAFLTPEFVNLGKVSVLRIIPRVLKMISLYPGVKTTAGALVQSVRRLVGVIILAAFVLAVLALTGLQLFMGTMKHKCVLWPLNWTNSYPRFDFNKHINNASEQYFLPMTLDALVCGNSSDAGRCPEGFSCLKTDSNPNYSFTSYDSFGWSLLSVFRLMMGDFWEDLFLLMTNGAGTYTTIIFLVLVFPSCFLLLSLILALVARVTVEQDRANVAKAKQREEEFIQILEVMKRREEEEEEEVSEKQPLAPQDKSSAAVTKSHEEERPAVGEVKEDQSSCPPCCLAFLKWNCCGCWRRLKQRLHTFVMNPFFDFGIVVCLIFNSILMAMEHYPMTIEFADLLYMTDLIFTMIYTAEALLKLVALDPYGYFKVGWHILDFIIVIVSLMDVTMADVEGLNVLYCFNVMRVLRLARWWPTFHTLIKIMWTAVWALRNLTLILLIMVFAFTVVGLQLFQKDYESNVCCIANDCELPRWHMNGLFQTFLLIFRIFCGEWIETMWDCMMVSNQSVCLIFFMTVVVIGYLLVLNLFLALLLSSVSAVNLAAPTEQGENNPLFAINQIKGCAARTRTWILEHLQGKKNHVNPDPKVVDSKKDNKKEYVGLTSMTSDQSVSEVVIESNTPENEDKEKKQQQDEDNKNHRENTPEDCCCHSCYHCCPFLNVDTSRGTWRVWSNFRRACFSIVQHKCFETFIISIILLSSAALVFEDIHLQQQTVLQMILDRADQVFTYVFLLEMLLKWIAYGFKKYFTSVWCWIDFLILAVSLMSVTVDMLGYSQLEVGLILRTLRALRPLRALSRFQCLRVVLQALAVTLPALFDVLLVALTVCLMFSIVGVRLFAGKFSYCYNTTSEQLLLDEEAGNKTDCFILIDENFTDIVWKNAKLNFDNVGQSYLSLLHMATFSGWLNIMYAAVDSTQVESQPVYENRPYMYLYFICFIIIGCFFTFNLFVRVFINMLDQLTHKMGGKHLFMTEEQQKLSRGMKRRLSRTTRKPVPRPQNKCRALLFDLVTKPAFDVFVVVVICLKMVTLMVETDEQSNEKDLILHWINFVFIIIFLIEFLLKIIALGRHYFSDWLNILDFVVIILSIVGMFIFDFLEKYLISPNFFPVLRLARISRIIPVIPWLVAFVLSLPALFNICLLLFLLIFTYSIFGMFSFAYVRNEHPLLYFETFGSSMMSMFTLTTTTGLDFLLRPILDTPPDCDPYMQNPGSTVLGNCGSPILGIIFFSSYIILSVLLVVHMYIAVVLETFNMDDTENLSDNELQMFYKTWRMFDTDGSQVIQYSQLSDFCDTLQDPLRIPKPNTIKLIHMDLPLLPGDKIHCTDVLLAFTAEVFGDSGQRDAIKARIEEKFMTNKLPKLSYEPISSTLQRKHEEVAATVIQRAYRKHVLQDRDVEATAAEPAGGASGV
uniref:Sodium channel protein type 4 subunit alpha B-like n=1 Tax=Seriola dumerili TaxID=41447 RepID=A0A3B4VQU5_SERDU